MRNIFHYLIILGFSLPAFAQSPLIEAYRPKPINSPFASSGDTSMQPDDLGSVLAVCLLIICVYAFYWLKQKA